jgi:hypothetical protein
MAVGVKAGDLDEIHPAKAKHCAAGERITNPKPGGGQEVNGFFSVA